MSFLVRGSSLPYHFFSLSSLCSCHRHALTWKLRLPTEFRGRRPGMSLPTLLFMYQHPRLFSLSLISLPTLKVLVWIPRDIDYHINGMWPSVAVWSWASVKVCSCVWSRDFGNMLTFTCDEWFGCYSGVRRVSGNKIKVTNMFKR